MVFVAWHQSTWEKCYVKGIALPVLSAIWKLWMLISLFFFQRMHTENFLAGINAMYCLEAFQADRNFSQNAWFLIINVTLTGVEMVEEVTLVRTAYSLSRRSCQGGLPGFIIPYNNVYPWNKTSPRFLETAVFHLFIHGHYRTEGNILVGGFKMGRGQFCWLTSRGTFFFW